jgi:GNAT superfamily N-acetyltransferase
MLLHWVLRAEDGYDEARPWPWDAVYAPPFDPRLAAAVRSRPPDDAWRGELTIVLALRDGRVVGTRILEDVQQPLLWRLGDMEAGADGRLGYACRPVPKPAGRRIAGVTNLWVAHRFRRQGVGTALSTAAARYAGVTIRDLAWGTPFSPAGLAGARRYAMQGRHLVVYASGGQAQG